MRYKGHNILAIILATLVFYGIEFVIYGLVLTPEQYQGYTGLTAEQAAASADRMPFGILSPLLQVIGLSLVIKWRAAPGPFANMWTAMIAAVCFAFAGALYSYVYGAHTLDYLPINFAHFLVCYGAAGAILGAWK